MNKIPTSFKTQAASTQAPKPEEASHTTIFSRGKGFGSKLIVSLKNLFSRTDKSSASAAVTKAVPQATIDSIKTENKTSDSVKLSPRARVRMEYRQLLNLEASKAKVQSYEEKVSIFDSAISRLERGDKLKDWEEIALDEVLPKLQTAVEKNGKLDESIKQQLLLDLLEFRRNLTELQMKSV